jgi:AraC-like DNA-binding protein
MENHRRSSSLNLIAYAVQRDVAAEELCKRSMINLEELSSNPGYTVTPKQFNDLWLNASRLTNDPNVGLHLGESLQLAALGIIGQIIQTSRTVEEALTHAASLVHLFTDMFTMHVDRGSKTFEVHFIPEPGMEKEYPFAFRQMMDLSMVFVIHELDGLVFEKIRPLSVTLPSCESSEYERIFRCKPKKENTKYSMTFGNTYLDLPIVTANHDLQQLLLKKAALMQSSSDQPRSLRDTITQFISSNAYLGVPSLDEIAANFNTSTRSLQRRLQDEGVTYQYLTDSIRKSLALHYLESGTHAVKEISYILGYNELSAFTRAFKRWTGTTPALYQKGTGKI